MVVDICQYGFSVVNTISIQILFLSAIKEKCPPDPKGIVGEINEELKGALKYIDGEQPTSEYADRLSKSVENVKANEKWRRDYMTMAMKIKEENKITDLSRIISAIRKMREDTNNEKIMYIFSLDENQLTEILSLLDQYPDKDEWELAEMILYK